MAATAVDAVDAVFIHTAHVFNLLSYQYSMDNVYNFTPCLTLNIMYMFKVRSGLTRGSVLLAVVLGAATGYYTWKPVFDPAERDKLLLKYSTHDTSGNVR